MHNTRFVHFVNVRNDVWEVWHCCYGDEPYAASKLSETTADTLCNTLAQDTFVIEDANGNEGVYY